MGNGGFDPSLFHDTDRRKYYIYRPWGPRHHSDPHCTIVMQEFFPQTQTLSKTRKTLFTGTALRYTEGAHLYQKDGWYYLLVAEGGTSYEHAVVLLRAKNIDGPYELHPDGTMMTSWHLPENPLQKSGHGSLLETHTGEWYMAYLTSRPQRLPGVPLLWLPAGVATARSGVKRGSRVSPGTTAGRRWKGQTCATDRAGAGMTESCAVASENWRDDFSGPALDPHLQTLRIPFDDTLGSLSARSELFAAVWQRFA